MEDYLMRMEVYGSHLGSRLQARDIVENVLNETQSFQKIVIDFSGVTLATLSFCTEIFDTFSGMGKDFQTINENDFCKNVTDFCKQSLKPKELSHY